MIVVATQRSQPPFSRFCHAFVMCEHELVRPHVMPILTIFASCSCDGALQPASPKRNQTEFERADQTT